MKMALKIVKKIIVGAFLLYSYNLIAVSFNLMVPINLITILLVSFLDIPAMIMLVAALAVIF